MNFRDGTQMEVHTHLFCASSNPRQTLLVHQDVASMLGINSLHHFTVKEPRQLWEAQGLVAGLGPWRLRAPLTDGRCYTALLGWWQGIQGLRRIVWFRRGPDWQFTRLVGVLLRLLHRSRCRQSRGTVHGGRGGLVELQLLILAKERVVLHLIHRRLQDRTQRLNEAIRRCGGRLRLLVLVAGEGQLAPPGVRTLRYLHLVEVGLQLGLLLEEEPLLVQPELETAKKAGSAFLKCQKIAPASSFSSLPGEMSHYFPPGCLHLCWQISKYPHSHPQPPISCLKK